MLVLATGRCSIFDFVLNTLIENKGEVLNALNVFWTTKVLNEVFETDLIAYGVGIDDYLPVALRRNKELEKRATVVKYLPSPKIEDVVRIILTGSGWDSYRDTGKVFGHPMPKGLTNGSLLPFPIYTPTDKALIGHDAPIAADAVAAKYGIRRERRALQAAMMVSQYAASRGIRLADTKFEFSQLLDGSLVLVDEKATPDSSRFVDENTWLKASSKGKFPPSLDKQYVREWGKRLGIDKLDPENPEDVRHVHSLVVPEDIISMTTRIYRYIFWRLTGSKLETFQREEMGIAVKDPKPKVEILIGSVSDECQTSNGVRLLKGKVSGGRVSVMSCDRNPSELREFARQELINADVIIAGAGMAARLPGFVKSELCALGHPEIPVIGVAFAGSSSIDNQAAIACIERIPGQPVELDANGHAYFSSDGFDGACQAALKSEFLPRNIEQKPAQIGYINL